MIAKPLLKTAASWIAIAAFAAAAPRRRRRPTARRRAGPADAEAAQPSSMPPSGNWRSAPSTKARIAWVYNTYINYDTEWLLQRSDADGTEARVRLASGAARFANVELPPDHRRKVDLLRLGLTLPAPQREGAAEQLSQITTRLASIYSTGRIDYQGRQVTLDDLETLMGTERNPARLEEMWTKWHAIAAPMRARLCAHGRDRQRRRARSRLRGCRPDVAVELRHAGRPRWRREVERLWGQMQPFYEQLHCYVRAAPQRHYGDAVVPLDQPDPRRSPRQHVGAGLVRPHAASCVRAGGRPTYDTHPIAHSASATMPGG